MRNSLSFMYTMNEWRLTYTYEYESATAHYYISRTFIEPIKHERINLNADIPSFFFFSPFLFNIISI